MSIKCISKNCPFPDTDHENCHFIDCCDFAVEQPTNAQKIRSMSDEDLAWELMLWRCEAAAKYHGIESQYPDTQSTILEWLQKPAE